MESRNYPRISLSGEYNSRGKNGFTLPELLIVVAIIAVLTAIAIPVFSKQLEKSREATDMANCRTAYAELITSYLEDGKEHEVEVLCKQTQLGWNYESGIIGSYISDGEVTTSNTPMTGEIVLIQGFDQRHYAAWNPPGANVGKGATIIMKIDKEGAVTVDIYR